MRALTLRVGRENLLHATRAIANEKVENVDRMGEGICAGLALNNKRQVLRREDMGFHVGHKRLSISVEMATFDLLHLLASHCQLHVRCKQAALCLISIIKSTAAHQRSN